MSLSDASDTVPITGAVATTRFIIGRERKRLRAVKKCGTRRTARSCTTTSVGHGEARGAA